MKLFTTLFVMLPLLAVSAVKTPALVIKNNFKEMAAVKLLSSATEAKGVKVMGSSFETSLTHLLQSSNLFKVVERKQIEEFLEEIDFNESGVVGEKATEKLAMKGANYMMFVTLNGADFSAEKQAYAAINRRDETLILVAEMGVKILNVSSGVIEYSLPLLKVELAQESKQLRPGQAGKKNDIWSDAGVALARSVINELASTVKPAKVLAVNGAQLLVNQGSTTGFALGVKVKVYASEKIVDEDSGEVFMNEVEIGSGVVKRGDHRKCFIKVSEDLGIAKGCVVRIEK